MKQIWFKDKMIAVLTENDAVEAVLRVLPENQCFEEMNEKDAIMTAVTIRLQEVLFMGRRKGMTVFKVLSRKDLESFRDKEVRKLLKELGWLDDSFVVLVMYKLDKVKEVFGVGVDRL